jgi:hypothetical protein
MKFAQKITGADKTGIDQNKLFSLLKGLAIDSARSKLSGVDTTKQTDSTTGTAGTAVVVVPNTGVHVTDGVSTTAAPKTGFDTAIGKMANCAASLANFINFYRAELGLKPVTIPSGVTITAALPALDKTLSGVATTGAVDYTTGKAQLDYQRNNFATILFAANELAVALGYAKLSDASGGVADSTNLLLVANTTTAASVNASSANSLADSEVDAALTALAGNYATLSSFINNVIDPDEAVNITDNTSGTASSAVPPAIAEVTVPSAYTTAGTDCAPKAGVDTALGIIEANISDLTLKTNQLIRFLGEDGGFTLLTDSTGQSPDATIATFTVNQTAVTGTTVCIDYTTALASLTAVNNNMASIAAKVNEISGKYGLTPLDVSLMTGTVSNTIANVPTTGTGNDGTADQTMSDTEVDAFLAATRNNMATLAARLNALDNSGSQQSLSVVYAE